MSTGRGRVRLMAVWTLLAALVVLIVVVERHGGAAHDGSDPHGADDGPRWLMPAPIEKLGAIEVMHEGRLHRFERDGSGAWLYHGAHAGQDAAHAHRSEPAASQRIEQALGGFGRTRVERSLPLDAALAAEYGVAAPSVIVLVYAPGSVQPWMQYAIGGKTPDGYGRYVLPVGSSAVVTIANYQVNGLLELVAAMAKDAT